MSIAAPTSTLPKVDIQLYEEANRWIVRIDGIPVAEISVAAKNSDIEIVANIDASGAVVVLRHSGNASMSVPTNSDATLGIPVRLREVDMRENGGEQGDRAPEVTHYTVDEGKSIPLSSIETPPGNVPWLRPRGELEAVAQIEPLTDWEEGLIRDGSRKVLSVLVDPEDSGRVIGYRIFATAGLTRITDREGEVQFEDEIGIETPLLDPIDLLPTPGGVGKVASGVGGKILAKSLGKKAASAGVTLPMATVLRLRRIAIAIGRRGGIKATEKIPSLVLKITEDGIVHSFDSHAAQWFGRVVNKSTHLPLWRELIARVALSKQVFRWSSKGASTIAHLGQSEGKYLVVQFFEETGELATAFVPKQGQLRGMLKAIRAVP